MSANDLRTRRRDRHLDACKCMSFELTTRLKILQGQQGLSDCPQGEKPISALQTQAKAHKHQFLNRTLLREMRHVNRMEIFTPILTMKPSVDRIIP
jgi:hypothetical protein